MISLKEFESVGIVGFGGYLPYWRLDVGNIGLHWGIDGERIKKGLGVKQKTVASEDEDTLTMSIEASLVALERANIDPKQIGAIFVGSESHPYAVKTTGTMVGEVLGVGTDYFCADLQFACKAGTAGIQIVAAMIEAGIIDYGLVIAADKAQSRPGDALEYTAAAGAAAFILGNKKEEYFARLINTYSYSSDTPDFWRRPRERFPSHGGRFTGEPGYFAHVENCLERFLEKTGKKVQDFDSVIFHMPNEKFPLKVAKKFGFSVDQLKLGFLVSQIGNPYAASSPLGLVSVLEQSAIDKNILLISYGSGAGSDAFWLKTEKELQNATDTNITKRMTHYLDNFESIGYLDYLKKWETI